MFRFKTLGSLAVAAVVAVAFVGCAAEAPAPRLPPQRARPVSNRLRRLTAPGLDPRRGRTG